MAVMLDTVHTHTHTHTQGDLINNVGVRLMLALGIIHKNDR